MTYKIFTLAIISLLFSSNVSAVALVFPIYGNWCGPGYPAAGENPTPIDIVDQACKVHDLGYTECAQRDDQLMCEANIDLDLVESLNKDVGKLDKNQLMVANNIGKYFSFQSPFKALSENAKTLFTDRFQVATELSDSATQALGGLGNKFTDSLTYIKDVVVNTVNDFMGTEDDQLEDTDEQ